MIDTQVYLGHWPFRRLPDDEPAALVARLRAIGVRNAWAGHFDALLHEDVSAVNARLAECCAGTESGFLVPFGSVNPKLPDWRDDVRRCHETHRMPGIRLHPNYHGYALDDPLTAELFEEARKRKLIIQIALKMEDERTQHPLVRVPAVNLAPLSDLLPRMPGLRVILLNGPFDLRNETLARLVRSGRIAVDLAMIEGVAGVARLVEQVGAEQVLFSTFAPLFIPESALLKLKESELPDTTREAITSANARRWSD